MKSNYIADAVGAVYPFQGEGTSYNDIIRGEISAEEAYHQVLSGFEFLKGRQRLRDFLKDHHDASVFWKNEAKKEYEKPVDTTGLWGVVVESFVGASKMLGLESALDVLKKGEELGLRNYKSMLEIDELTTYQRDKVRDILIPRQKKHIETLSAMIKQYHRKL